MTHRTAPAPLTTPGWVDRAAWPHAPRTFVHPEGRLHYVDEGRGAPLVLVHGTPTWSFEWRHVIARCAATHRVLALDHLGFGLSERPPEADYTPEGHAHRFAAWIERVAPQEPVTLVVHDYGGPIALPWALAHASRLRHLVVVNRWMWPFDDDPVLRSRAALVRGAAGRLLYRHANASLRLILPSAWKDRALLAPAIHRHYLAPFPDPEGRERVLFRLARALLDARAHYAALWDARARLAGVPVTVIWGMEDAALPPRMLWRWLTALPHAHVVTLEDAGHWPHEERPTAFLRALARALERRDAAE